MAPPVISQQAANIFRITHRDNIPWILDNGLHCPNSPVCDPNFVPIGHPEIIETRRSRNVPIAPGGTLADYVPFYFTPYSPMLYNIVTGWGVQRRRRDEIVIIWTSLPTLQEAETPFVFSDQHGVTVLADFHNDLARLDRIAWDILEARDFRKDPLDPLKFERYQAEALVHRAIEVDQIRGFVCYDQAVRDNVRMEALARGIQASIEAKPSWYL